MSINFIINPLILRERSMASEYCPACGNRLPMQSAFCPACGAAQTTSAPLPTVSSPQQSSPALLPTVLPPRQTPDMGTGRLPAAHMLHQRYRLLHTVGQGGMGAVYVAQDTQLGDRLVAVKEMSMSRLTPQEIPLAIEQFRREAHLLASLHHPNLPAIHEYFQENDRWYLVMSFIEGQNLQAALNAAPGNKLPVNEVVRIGIELCEVLEYLHTHDPQIIFRDLKPLNIMLTPKGHICLIDFGIARHFKQEQSKDTGYYYSVGYAPPEQYGQSQTSPRSDIYSLGATLHQMLSGHNPASKPFQFPNLQLIDPTIPVPLAKLIAQMLEMDEQARPGSVAEVKKQLQNILSAQATSLPATVLADQSPISSKPVAPPLPATVLADQSPISSQSVASPPTKAQTNIFRFGRRELIVILVGIILVPLLKLLISGLLLGLQDAISIFGLSIPGQILYNIEEAFSYASFFFFGIEFGPWVGLGVVGLGIFIASWFRFIVIPYAYDWHGLIIYAILGFIVGLTILKTRGHFTNWGNILFVSVTSAFIFIVCQFLVAILISLAAGPGFSLSTYISLSFPEWLIESGPLLVLLPLLLLGFNALKKAPVLGRVLHKLT